VGEFFDEHLYGYAVLEGEGDGGAKESMRPETVEPSLAHADEDFASSPEG